MKGLAFEITCYWCGGDCELLAPSTVRGRLTQAMTKCADCGREALVRVALEPVACPASQRRAEARNLRLVTA